MSKTKRLPGMRAMAFCILLSCLLLLFPQAVRAAGPDEAEITVEQVFTNLTADTVGDTFSYELAAVTPGAPMPAGSTPYNFNISGASGSATFTMQYTAAGTYEYSLRQVVGTPQAGYVYDAAVYKVEVTVLPDGSGGFLAYAFVKNSSNVKVDPVRFQSSYKGLPGPAFFTKEIKDPATGLYTGSINITDVTQPLDYKAELGMPASMNGYTAVALVDELPAALELWDTATPSNCVIVKVGATDVTTDATWGALSYNPFTCQVTYTFLAGRISSLAGQTVTMELSARITDPSVGSIRNKARLVTNTAATPEAETPDSYIWGVIEGYAWEDANGNGLQDIGEAAAPGVKVELQSKSGNTWVAQASTTTKADGTYRFEAKYGTYRVVFPGRPPKVFTAKHAGGTPTDKDSDADANGATDAVTLSGTQQKHKLDAGYLTIALPRPRDITKVVLDGSREADSLTVTDPREDVQYRIRVQLGSLAGYHSMELVDALDSRLNYKSAQVYVNGTDITAKGSLSFDQATSTLRYAFAAPVDRAALENQVVELRLTVTIHPNLNSYDDIRNRAGIVVNGGSPVTSTDNPRLVLNYGYITGYVFEDTNQNGLRDDPNPDYLLGMRVTLEGYTNGTWTVVQTTTAAADGRYVFSDKSGLNAPQPFGKYRVSVEDTNSQFTYAQKNTDGLPYRGNSSDADPGTGYAGMELQPWIRQPIVGIGLVPKKADDVPEPRQSTIQKEPSTQRANPGDNVDYRISGFGNESGGTMPEFGVTDMVPNGLVFTSGSFPAFAGGQGVVYSINYITNYNSSYRVLHSGVSASSPFFFTAPSLQAGERVTMITMSANNVPAGFSVGNSITFSFQVAQNAPERIVNTAYHSDGKNSRFTVSPNLDTVDEVEITEETTTAVPEIIPPLGDFEQDALGEWSLLNVILVLAGLLMLVVLGIRAVGGKRRRDYGEDGEDLPPEVERNANPVLLAAAILLWAASAIVMLLTQHWFVMVFVNRWSILVAVLAIASVVAAWLSSRKTNTDNEIEEDTVEAG